MPASAAYEVLEIDHSGFSPGYDVRDVDGIRWSVKLGPEAQSEVTASRVLWAIGFHQPATYLVTTWTLTGTASSEVPRDDGPARFRREPAEETVVSEWSWYENPFVDTRPFKGLLVVNLLLNNWDWKTSNNRIYDITAGNGGRRRVYVVRDLGASLGKTSFPGLLKPTPFRLLAQGSRNDLEDFEEQGFIEGVDEGRVKFDYSGIHGALVATVSVADVLWTCDRLARISDVQWHDAFRAGGYSEDEQRRYVAKIKEKIRQGLALRG